MVGLVNGRDEDAVIPMGLAALAGMRTASASCREQSELWLRKNAHFHEILGLCGDTISLLDRASCCWWGCSGRDSPHAMEYLIGGSVTAARAGIELAFDGFYDESVGMCRGIAERVNLLVLFVFSVTDFGTWIASDDRQKFRLFSPVKVRTKLEQLGREVPFPEEYYRALSDRGVHAGAIPQVYNRERRPLASGIFQEAGFELCLSEIGAALGQAGSTGLAVLSHVPIELRQEVLAYPVRLAEKVNSVAGISLSTLDQHLARSAQASGSAQQARVARHADPSSALPSVPT